MAREAASAQSNLRGTYRTFALAGALSLNICAWPASADTAAQSPPPVECWWRTTIGAIRVGEPFGLILTCAAIDTGSVRAEVERGRLDPKAIELPPFEVLGGVNAPDLRQGDRVFFQNHYTLRFVNDAFFNKDIPLPPLSIVYRLQTRAGAESAATQGIEQRFAMPHGSIRVVSLVPTDATDIRDTSAASFAEIDALSSRGRLLTAAGMGLTALGALIMVVGAARSIAGRSPVASRETHAVHNRTILRAVAQELSAVGRARDEAGWTRDLVARALACCRILSEIALSGRVSHQVGARLTPAAGALVFKQRWPSSQCVLVSGSITPKTLARELADRTVDHRFAALDLGSMQRTLVEFTQVLYSGPGALDEGMLDGGLSAARRLARRLRFEENWLRRIASRFRPFPSGEGVQ